jgi:hypothetical protein
MHYMETYNASEGFFGIQDDPADKSMLLMLDYDCFYEFIPTPSPSRGEGSSYSPSAKETSVGSNLPPLPSGGDGGGCVPLWAVEPGKNYAMVISTSCGLWRYMIGDTIRFTSTNPYKFVISGRTKSFINAFGEELVEDNASRAIRAASLATGADIKDYTAAPVYMETDKRGRHQWLIEFNVLPNDMDNFVKTLDFELKRLNSDYDAKRYKDISLTEPEITVARENLFEDWLRKKGRIGGQNKIPRLENNRDIIDEMLEMNA